MIADIRYGSLHEGSGTVLSDGTGNLWTDFDDLVSFYAIWMHGEIADTFPRKGDRFTKGIAGEGIFIVVCHIRGIHSLKNNVSVWLIGDKIDWMAKFF